MTTTITCLTQLDEYPCPNCDDITEAEYNTTSKEYLCFRCGKVERTEAV